MKASGQSPKCTARLRRAAAPNIHARERRRTLVDKRALIVACGQVVRDYREQRGMSLGALARTSTVPRARIEMIEEGSVASINAEFAVDVLYIYKALDVPTKTFVQKISRLSKSLVH
jgi:ribosome-binding protein aMBF1 (putative translation factor)